MTLTSDHRAKQRAAFNRVWVKTVLISPLEDCQVDMFLDAIEAVD